MSKPIFFTLGAALLFGSVIALGSAGQANAGSVATAGHSSVPAISDNSGPDNFGPDNSGLSQQVHSRQRGSYSFNFSYGGRSPYYGGGRGYGYRSYRNRPYGYGYYNRPRSRHQYYRAPQRHNYYRGGSHVQWCHNRYRSYNARTDQWFGYDGYYHRCRSPYSR